MAAPNRGEEAGADADDAGFLRGTGRRAAEVIVRSGDDGNRALIDKCLATSAAVAESDLASILRNSSIFPLMPPFALISAMATSIPSMAGASAEPGYLWHTLRRR